MGGKIVGDRTGGKRHGEFRKASAIASHENFAEGVLLLEDAMDRKRIEKFVGEKATDGNAGGDFDGWAALPFLDEVREVRRKLVAARTRALDRDVAKRMVEIRKLRLSKFEDLAGQTANASADFDKKKFGGTIELLPHFGELTSQ